MEAAMASSARLTGIAPQFLVDDLSRSIEYYCRCLGFSLDFNYETFYASVSRRRLRNSFQGRVEDGGRQGSSQAVRASRRVYRSRQRGCLA